MPRITFKAVAAPVQGGAMDPKELVRNALRENPDVRLVLDVAARAKDMEAREQPREIGGSTEVVAIPCNPQIPVSWGVLRY